MTWTPREEAQFDRACTYCGQAIRRWGNGNWQGYNGLFTCYRGQFPNRSDIAAATPHPTTSARYSRSNAGHSLSVVSV